MKCKLTKVQKELLEAMAQNPPVRVLWVGPTMVGDDFYYRDDTGRICNRTVAKLLHTGHLRHKDQKSLEVVLA